MYRVNLLPTELQPVRRIYGMLTIALIILYSMGLLVTFFFCEFKINEKSEILEQKQRILAKVEEEAGQVFTVKENRQEVEAKVDVLRGLIDGRSETTGMILDIYGLALPSMIELNLAYSHDHPEGNTITIEGKSDSLTSVGGFVKDLSGLSYFTEVILVKFHESKGDEAVIFRIIAQTDRGGQ